MPATSPPVCLTVIIPAINECAQIGRAVQSAWDAGADQVILCDGGSQDGTRERAAAHAAAIVTSLPGRARQQNAGASAARGSILIFQHADNWFAPQAFDDLRRLAASCSPILGAFRQCIDGPGPLYRLLECGNASRVRLLGVPYGDQGIFISRDLFHALGGFPDVPLMEDVLLMKRARLRVRPRLLAGPLHVGVRRWQQRGIMGQTVRNWSLMTALHLGVSPERLAKYYPRHDES